jgi:DNA polymerase I
VKPSPFCLLDELDAPLDESNIGRFTELLKKFVKDSQFIIITHNKRTVAAANAIYGVTMEERGVSKTVSMRFNHERGEAEARHPATVAEAVRGAPARCRPRQRPAPERRPRHGEMAPRRRVQPRLPLLLRDPGAARADGFPTNALHGWVKSLWRLADQEKPDGVLVFFDLGGAQDRLALLPSTRRSARRCRRRSQSRSRSSRRLTRAMGLGGIEQDGVESDDLLASDAAALAGRGPEVLIVSSDKDFAQIVGDRIRIMLPPPTANPKLGWRLMDAAGVVEKFGVPPSQIADYLALVGDTSDNIPGVGGVGPKTAAKWLAEFGSLEGVIGAADRIAPERFRAPGGGLGRPAAPEPEGHDAQPVSLPPPAAEAASARPGELYGILESMEMRSTLAEARQRYGQPELF